MFVRRNRMLLSKIVIVVLRLFSIQMVGLHIVMVAALVAATPSHAAKPNIRDGSTKEKAIPLKQRGLEAIDEEMAWMMKLHGCTPLIATRNALTEAVRQIKAGKKKSVRPPQPWEHATLEHAGRWCSYWMIRTPRGKRHIYFDTGISINTPGEVVRQESSRAQYMGRLIESLKVETNL